jgi:LmbE family N-acetylglucosaminyl deacetylase
VYDHPDHIAIHRATTAAFFSSGVLGDDAPRRLFYFTLVSDVFRGLAAATRGRGIIDGLDADVFATAPATIAVSFDASRYVDRKYLALTAHRSAFGVTPEMLQSPPDGVAQLLRAFRPVFEREVFVLGGVRGPVHQWPLPDFFDGLDTAELSTRSATDGRSSAAG